MDDTKNNIFSIAASNDKITTTEEPGIPVNRYFIEDVNGEGREAEGFLLFTPQHIAVMRDDGDGPIPILVYNINLVKFASLVPYEDDVEPPLPW